MTKKLLASSSDYLCMCMYLIIHFLFIFSHSIDISFVSWENMYITFVSRWKVLLKHYDFISPLKQIKSSWEDFQSINTWICLFLTPHIVWHESYGKNKLFFYYYFYAGMEVHSSGVGRKRKREESNGEIRECFRKIPRRTLVSVGKVAFSRHPSVMT